MDISLNGLLDAIGVNQQQTEVAKSSIQDTLSKLGNLSQSSQDAIADSGKQSQIIQAASDNADLKAQQNTLRAATLLGTNMDDQGELVSSLSEDIRDSYAQVKDLNSRIADKQSVGVLDNPLEYVFNSIELPSLTEQRDTLQKQNALANQQLNNIFQLTDQAHQANLATRQTVNEGTIAANNQKIADAAQIEANKSAESGLLTNIQGVQAIQKLNQDELQGVSAGLSAINAQKHLELEQQRNSLARQANELALEERRLRIEAKKSDEKDEQDFADTTNLGLKALGKAEMSKDQILKLMKVKGALGNIVQEAYLSGLGLQSTGKVMIGSSAAGAATVITQAGSKFDGNQQPVADFIKGAYDQIKTTGQLNGMPVNMNKPEEVTNAVNALIKANSDRMKNVINPNDSSNIYGLPPVKSIIDVAPAIQQTQLFQKIIAPSLAAGMTKTDPQLLVNATTAAIKDGTLDYNTAVKDLSTFFNAGLQANIALKQYTKFGVEVPTSLNYKLNYLPDGANFPISGDAKYNLNDPSQVARILNRKLDTTGVYTRPDITP